jgi:hypothetical protein
MGFTHYFYRKEKLDQKTFDLFVKDVKAIFADTKRQKRIAIVNGWGEMGTQPIANSEEICFNGVQNTKTNVDNSHETMYISRVANKSIFTPDSPSLSGFAKQQGSLMTGL